MAESRLASSFGSGEREVCEEVAHRTFPLACGLESEGAGSASRVLAFEGQEEES